MADSVSECTTINAPVAEIMTVLLDFERYPEWARDLKEAEVLTRDDAGRAAEVRFRAAGMGYSTGYTLRYDHAEPGRLAWKLIDGDLTRKLDGEYRLRPTEDGAGTEVTYELEVELKLPIPRFVKNRTQVKIVHTALKELKARSEGRP